VPPQWRQDPGWILCSHTLHIVGILCLFPHERWQGFTLLLLTILFRRSAGIGRIDFTYLELVRRGPIKQRDRESTDSRASNVWVYQRRPEHGNGRNARGGTEAVFFIISSPRTIRPSERIPVFSIFANMTFFSGYLTAS